MKTFSRRTATGMIVAAAMFPLTAKAQSSGNGLDVFTILEREHRAALDLTNRIIGATDETSRGQLLQNLADALTIHNANEENIVYPAIRDAAAKPDDAAMLYHQQDDAKVVIAQLMNTPKMSSTFTDGMRQLQTALTAHIRQEETVDFPALRTALGARIAVLNTATAQLRSHWVMRPS